MSELSVGFGYPEEWTAFTEKHPLFMEKLPKLMDTLERIYTRTEKTESSIDGVMVILGIQCIDEFREILLLCGNGFGIGGLKILRCLYERAVTMEYLAKYPDKVDSFLDYNAINLGKFYKHIAREIDIQNRFSPEKIKEIEETYKQAEDIFHRRPWSGLNTLDMAEKAAEGSNKEDGLFGLYGLCFFRPTIHIHTTALSFNDWVEANEHGMGIKEHAQRRMTWQTLKSAHAVILHVLKIQDNYFKLGLDNEVVDDFMAVWSKRTAV